MIKYFEKLFLYQKVHLSFYSSFKNEISTHCVCRSWLRSLRDGCPLDKYPEMVRLFFLNVYLLSFVLIEGNLVSAMKKKLEKEAMEQEIDE